MDSCTDGKDVSYETLILHGKLHIIATIQTALLSTLCCQFYEVHEGIFSLPMFRAYMTRKSRWLTGPLAALPALGREQECQWGWEQWCPLMKDAAVMELWTWKGRLIRALRLACLVRWRSESSTAAPFCNGSYVSPGNTMTARLCLLRRKKVYFLEFSCNLCVFLGLLYRKLN